MLLKPFRKRATICHQSTVLAVSEIRTTDSMLISAGEDDIIYISNPIDGVLIRTVIVAISSICALGSLDNGLGTKSILAGSSKGIIQIIDFATGDLVNSLRHRGLRAMAVSDECGLIISAGLEGNIVTRDHQTGDVMSAGGDSDIFSIALIQDGSTPRIASGGNEKIVNLWDARSGEHVGLIETETTVYTIAFSSESRLLAVGGRGSDITVFETESFDLIHRLVGHVGVVLVLATSRFNSMLVSGSADKSIRLWDLHLGTILQVLENGHVGAVTCLSIGGTDEDPWIASGSFDGKVIVWHQVGNNDENDAPVGTE